MDRINFQPIPVEVQLERLRKFSQLHSAEVTEDELQHLARDAPPWPLAPGCIRSLRVHTQLGEDRDTIAKKRFLENVAMYSQGDLAVSIYPCNFRPGDILDGGSTVPEGRALGERNIEWIIIQLMANNHLPNVPRPFGGSVQGACGDELLTAAWAAQEAFVQVHAKFGNALWHTCYEFGENVAWGPMWHYPVLRLATVGPPTIAFKEFSNAMILKESL